MRPATGAIIVAVLAVGGYFGWREFGHKPAPAPAPPPVPVSAAQAKDAQIAVYLRGIGTVQALNAVEIRPQVGGILLTVPVKEGDLVRKGDVLAVIDPRPFQAALEQAQAQKVQDQAQLANAQADLGRYATLARSEFASRQQVDTQRASVDQLTGRIAADQAQIDTAQINLGYTVLHSPLDGRIGLRRVDPGNLVTANQTGLGIFSVVQVRPIAVVFTLPDSNLPQIRDAMARGPVPVLADTSDQSQQLAAGTLLTPNNSVDPASGTIQLKAVFPNTDDRLTPGQFVSARLQSNVVKGIGVPHDAVQHGQEHLFVFAVKPDKTAELRNVEVAYDDGATAVIAHGVASGDTVVTAGQTRVGNGTKLAVRDGANTDPPAQPEQSAQK